MLLKTPQEEITCVIQISRTNWDNAPPQKIHSLYYRCDNFFPDHCDEQEDAQLYFQVIRS